MLKVSGKCCICYLLFKHLEHQSTGFANWIQHTLYTESVVFLAASKFDGADSEAWGDTPDVVESEAGKLAGPAEGDENTAECCQDDVTAVFGAIEAFVGVPPNAVNTVLGIRLSEDVFESDLQIKN